MVTCLRSINEEDAALRGIEVPNAWRRLRKVCEQLHTLQVHTVWLLSLPEGGGGGGGSTRRITYYEQIENEPKMITDEQ